MNKQERGDWLIVLTSFLSFAVVWGVGYDIIGLFFRSLHQEFGWDRTQLSLMATSLSFSYGLSLPIVGWLLDRIDTRIVMTCGAIGAGIAVILGGMAHSLGTLLGSYWLLGMSTTAATFVPISTIIAKRFGERRGVALGIAMAGVPAGEFIMTVVTGYAIAASGWRMARLLVSLPLFLVVAPAIYITLRNPSADKEGEGQAAQTADSLPGLELRDALESRAFWMIVGMWLFYTAAMSVLIVHGVPFLEDTGYTTRQAATFWGALLGSTAFGRPFVGWLSDKIGARAALALSFIGVILSFFFLLGAAHVLMLAVFLVLFGTLTSGPMVTLPIIQADTLGLKRFGSISGLTNLGFSAGLGIGPLIGGRILDLSGSYFIAFLVAAACIVPALISLILCTRPKSFDGQQSLAPPSMTGATLARQ